MQKQNLQKLRFFVPYEPKNRMEPTAARNPVNSSMFFVLYLLSDDKRRAKKFIVWQEVLDQEKERRKSSPIFPKTKTCPNKLLQERERRVAMASIIIREHLLSPSLFGFSCLKLQLSFLLTFIFSFVCGVCA
jgi:hypothetical protein